ncbi:hypothetical protein HPB51_028864 [Rhipicephalus microplus]|uniref:Uncharacterized protein n=1 Tax=Rhipicephalus microplus TaxID=6941 RepID=A0A9J6CVV2_RHIMP|nr:hypothetical protein HPB51_028864 [Rhipicephalus microplus]
MGDMAYRELHSTACFQGGLFHRRELCAVAASGIASLEVVELSGYFCGNPHDSLESKDSLQPPPEHLSLLRPFLEGKRRRKRFRIEMSARLENCRSRGHLHRHEGRLREVGAGTCKVGPSRDCSASRHTTGTPNAPSYLSKKAPHPRPPRKRKNPAVESTISKKTAAPCDDGEPTDSGSSTDLPADYELEVANAIGTAASLERLLKLCLPSIYELDRNGSRVKKSESSPVPTPVEALDTTHTMEPEPAVAMHTISFLNPPVPTAEMLQDTSTYSSRNSQGFSELPKRVYSRFLMSHAT